MGSTKRGLSNFNTHFVVASIMLFYILTSTVTSTQIQGCSIQEMDIGPCLKPSDDPFLINSSCCKLLNKVVKSGYNCLCLLLLGSSIPPLSASAISLPLSNCLISLPPLTHCQSAATFQTNMSTEALEPPPFPHSAPSGGLTDHLTTGNEAGFIKISLHRALVMSLAFQAYIMLLNYLI
ncbi:hypothetical protein LINPERPRIM_LOCUS28162 [Linum perenne]